MKRLLVRSQHEIPPKETRARVDEWAKAQIDSVCESLDVGRRTDAERRDKAERAAGAFWRCSYNRTDKERGGPVHRGAENSGMGHGADRTLMAGKLGIISVDVDGLDNAGEGHEQDTQQRQNCDGGVFAQLVSP
jgi:hypothetical protein